MRTAAVRYVVFEPKVAWQDPLFSRPKTSPMLAALLMAANLLKLFDGVGVGPAKPLNESALRAKGNTRHWCSPSPLTSKKVLCAPRPTPHRPPPLRQTHPSLIRRLDTSPHLLLTLPSSNPSLSMEIHRNSTFSCHQSRRKTGGHLHIPLDPVGRHWKRRWTGTGLVRATFERCKES
jgi:hypothetical protein